MVPKKQEEKGLAKWWQSVRRNLASFWLKLKQLAQLVAVAAALLFVFGIVVVPWILFWFTGDIHEEMP